MEKIIGIDFGLKRTGVAIASLSPSIAFPLETISTNNLISFLKNIASKENISTFVIGESKKLSGDLNEIESHILNFIIQLQKEFPEKKIKRIDERFTSKIATQNIQMMNLPKSKRQKKETIDSLSAVIILEDYLKQVQ